MHHDVSCVKADFIVCIVRNDKDKTLFHRIQELDTYLNMLYRYVMKIKFKKIYKYMFDSELLTNRIQYYNY